MQLRGRLRHQAVDEGVDHGAFNKVVIFQDDEYVLRDCLHDLIDEHNEEALPLGLDVLDALQQRTRGGAKLGAAAGNTFDEILEEGGRIIVAGVQLVPTHRQAGVGCELGQQRGLAIAGGGRQQQQRFVEVGPQPIHQLRARQCVLSGPRDVELGFQQHDLTSSAIMGQALTTSPIVLCTSSTQ